MLILLRQYLIEKTLTDEEGDPLTDEEGNPTGETEQETHCVVVGGVVDDVVARERAAAETDPADPIRRVGTEYAEAVNRFATYEPTGDVDADGFPDGFVFKEVLSTTPADVQTPTVRKVKRNTE